VSTDPKRNPVPLSGAKSGRPNTVGLHPRELVRLLDTLDSAAPDTSPPNRDYIRWPFRRDALDLRVVHPDGREVHLSVACRNLSRSGMSVLHNTYMYPGTQCSVMLPHPVRGGVPVSARVARCIHRAGVVHEVGLIFASQIDVREFVRRDAFSDCFSLEQVKPEELRGSVLYVDPDPIGCRIFQHFLRGTSLRIRAVAGCAAALDSLEGNERLVITDLHLSDGAAPELIAGLRQRRCRAPIIVATSDTSPGARRVLFPAQPSALLARPFSQQTILRAIAEFLVVQNGSVAKPMATIAAPTLVETYIDAAKGYASQLHSLLAKGDAAGIRTLCFQISGTAPTVGFDDLGDLATEAANTLARGGSLRDADQAIRALIVACQRARPRSAA